MNASPPRIAFSWQECRQATICVEPTLINEDEAPGGDHLRRRCGLQALTGTTGESVRRIEFTGGDGADERTALVGAAGEQVL